MSILAWRSNRTTNTRPIHLEALQLMMPMYTKGSIQNYMQDLKAFGYIEITPRPGTTSMYTICDKADAHIQYEENRGEQVESSAADQLTSSVASVKNNNNKKNSRFMAVWSAYPEHRRNTVARDSKTWREFGDEALVDIIVEDLEARKETEAWRDVDGKWVPGLRKYLENKNWEKSLFFISKDINIIHLFNIDKTYFDMESNYYIRNASTIKKRALFHPCFNL